MIDLHEEIKRYGINKLSQDSGVSKTVIYSIIAWCNKDYDRKHNFEIKSLVKIMKTVGFLELKITKTNKI